MLTHKPVPLPQEDLLSLTKWLDHPGKAILEKVLRGQIALASVRAAELSLSSPLDVLANGPIGSKARELNIHAAKLKICLDVLELLSKPETELEFAKFEVE